MAQITIRPMEKEEAQKVQKIGRRAFNGMESLMVTKPKEALVAVQDGKITGAVMYKFMKNGSRKIGYVEYAFIDRDYHSQGIGGILYRAAVDLLWEKGCDAVTALVKDDNVGSWSLFLKNGFTRVSLPELVRQFGLSGALKQYFITPFCVGVGMEYYVALREKPCPSGKGGSGKQLLSFFLANFFLLLILLSSRIQYMATLSAAFFALLAGVVVAGYIGTRFSGRNWKFRHNNGGALICALICLVGVFPMVGNWYPERYEKTKEFRRDMGITALAEWLFLLGITAFAVFSGSSSQTILTIMGQFGTFFLIYRMIPFYPFESFGGGRVLSWNKWLYGVMTVCSLALVIASFNLL